MGLMDIARRDMLRFSTDTNGFAVPIIFADNNSPVNSVTAPGTAFKHHLRVNEHGAANTKTARVTIHEDALTALEYPVRDDNGEVNLINHRVTWTDITGEAKTYVIWENFPNETTGLIVCLL